MSENIEARVTFIFNPGIEGALMRKAGEVDEEIGSVDPEQGAYTLAQALQIVWHNEPAWLHENVLMGWTLDSWRRDLHESWAHVWPGPDGVTAD